MHLVDQREALAKHLLFWLQDQTYYRQRWHRILAELPMGEPEASAQLDTLLLEIHDAAEQFPYGYDPDDEAQAQQLHSRLHLLYHEVRHLQKLCGAYVARVHGS